MQCPGHSRDPESGRWMPSSVIVNCIPNSGDDYVMDDDHEYGLTGNQSDVLVVEEDLDVWAMNRHNARINLSEKPVSPDVLNIKHLLSFTSTNGTADTAAAADNNNNKENAYGYFMGERLDQLLSGNGKGIGSDGMNGSLSAMSSEQMINILKKIDSTEMTAEYERNPLLVMMNSLIYATHRPSTGGTRLCAALLPGETS